jgi:hypothetical protein
MSLFRLDQIGEFDFISAYSMISRFLRIIEYLSLPLLFALYSVVFLAAHNINEIDFRDTGRAFVVIAFAVPVMVLLIWFFIRDGYRSALIAFMVVVLFFSYGHIRELMKSFAITAPIFGRHRYLSVLFASILILWSWFVLKRIDSTQAWARRISLVGVIALILPIFTIGSSFLPGEWETLHADPLDRDEIVITGDEMPDVYYIILDGYGRKDVLEELYSFDNSEFLMSLQERGFYVAEESSSNYNTTRLSLASSLNLDYLQSIVELEDIDLNPRTAEGMIWDNTVRRHLHQFGFKTVAFETGRPWSSVDNADYYLEARGDQKMNALLPRTTFLNLFEAMLIKSTSFSLLVDSTKLIGTFEKAQSAIANEEHRIRIVYSMQKIQEIPHWQGNYFVFLHLLSPHPPFIFGASGERIDHDRPFTYGDGNNFMEIGSREDYIEGYIEQLQYINELALNAVDKILAESSTPPIIIIQGDHGPGAYLEWQSMEDSNLTERHAILNAYYLPGEGTDELYPSITPVNSFRLIFNAFFEGEYEMLEDRLFFTEKNGGYDLVEITDMVE